eukprot:g19050.t1
MTYLVSLAGEDSQANLGERDIAEHEHPLQGIMQELEAKRLESKKRRKARNTARWRQRQSEEAKEEESAKAKARARMQVRRQRQSAQSKEEERAGMQAAREGQTAERREEECEEARARMQAAREGQTAERKEEEREEARARMQAAREGQRPREGKKSVQRRKQGCRQHVKDKRPREWEQERAKARAGMNKKRQYQTEDEQMQDMDSSKERMKRLRCKRKKEEFAGNCQRSDKELGIGTIELGPAAEAAELEVGDLDLLVAAATWEVRLALARIQRAQPPGCQHFRVRHGGRVGWRADREPATPPTAWHGSGVVGMKTPSWHSYGPVMRDSGSGCSLLQACNAKTMCWCDNRAVAT